MSTNDILIGLDKRQFDEELDKVEGDAERSMASIAAGIRRTAELGIFFAQASGIAIDQILSLYIETGLRAIEFATALIAIEDISTLGATAVLRLGAQAGAIVLMAVQINKLQQQQRENAQQIGYGVSLLRAFTY